MEELEMESFLLVSSCFGAEQPAPENYNGGKLRELLDEHHMAAINTFFPAGDTYYGQFGNNSRIDYVCLPQTMLARVESCKVLFSAGKRLQPIPAAGKRDHMPLQCGFRHKLGFESAQPAFMWDRHALAQGVLHGHRHDELLQACEGRLAEFDLHARCHSTPDTLWHIINTAVVDAAQVCYTQQKKHASDPIDTQEAHAAMVDMRSHLVSLRKPVRLSHAGHSGFYLDFLTALLQQWKGLVAYWKARRQLDQLAKRDGQTRLAKQLGVFNGAWQRRQFAEMWKVARRLPGKNLGPKKRVYSLQQTDH
jgi:hypothetical protein